MRKIVFVSLLVALSVILAACGSSAAPASVGSGKPVNIKLESNPSPAVMGDIELILTVTDANGDPIPGASVDVAADHTDMSGMEMSASAAGQGDGKYSAKLNFSMSGAWKLTVNVRNSEGLDYKEDIDFKVQ